MESGSTSEDQKLEYASRLSGLLLNEGTDVLRWFLFDNIPRRIDSAPNLQKLLQDRKRDFQDILEDESASKNFGFTHEMFDILYPIDGIDPDVGNMEISLLFFLIRFLCELKPPTWLWWDENPGAHQKAPVFDVIRLARFKTKMKRIVHHYEIDTDGYEKAFPYVTQLCNRLRGYKLSAQRWNKDFIAYCGIEKLTKERKPMTLLSIMRWQTLEVAERNETYLVLKENFIKFAENKLLEWNEFISHFGQMQYLEVCKVNELDSQAEEFRTLVYYSNDPSNNGYLPAPDDISLSLNWRAVMDSIWKTSTPEDFKVMSLRPKPAKEEWGGRAVLKSKEKTLYSSIDDSVFIKGLPGDSELISKIRMAWKMHAIETCSSVTVFPYYRNETIAMDDITFNLSDDTGTFIEWTDVLLESSRFLTAPTRVIITGSPCIGKTTVLGKIFYQCATNDCPRLAQYDIVIYLDLALIKLEKPYVRIMDCVKRQLLDHITDTKLAKDVSLEEFERIINSRHGRGILFLFDNIDELDQSEEMYEFWDVIKSNTWSMCGIISTSKPFPSDEMNQDDSKTLFSATESYRFCKIDGFNKFDVRREVQRRVGDVIAKYSNGYDATLARHILNMVGIYHLDVYDGRHGSPVLCAILCTSMRMSILSKGIHTVPQTMGQALGTIFFGWFDNSNIVSSKFGLAVLESTLQGSVLPVKSDYLDDLQSLSTLGVIKNPDILNVGGRVVFSHPLLKDFIAAKVFDANNNKSCLHPYFYDSTDAIRLENFFMFCCEGYNINADFILDELNKLVTQSSDEEAAKLISVGMRCFQLCSNKSRDGHRNIASALKDHNSSNASDYYINQDLALSLTIDSPENLSHKSRESFLSFVAACRPGLARSGTIFPILRPPFPNSGTSFISDLHISSITSRVVTFVASVIAQLPFLTSLSLTDILLDSYADFAMISDSLTPKGTEVNSAISNLEISFLCETRFDLRKVPDFEILSSIFARLMFLEKFDISPLTLLNFMGLFDKSETVVPIRSVDLSNCHVMGNSCSIVGGLLRRCIFLRSLIISRNPIYDGLRYFLEAFRSFRILRVLQLENCCLSPESLSILTSSFESRRLQNSLQVLTIEGNHINEQDPLIEFASSLGHLSMLRSLNLSKNFLGDRTTCVLAAQLLNLPHIQELRLDYVHMGKLGFNALRSSLTELQCLEILSIGQNPLPPDAIAVISDWMGNSCKLKRTITDLTLSGITVDSPLQLTKDAARLMEQYLIALRRLRMLNMTNTVVKHPDLMIIMAAVANHPCMEKIILTESLVAIDAEERKSWSRLTVMP